jgi:hypothetical protein
MGLEATQFSDGTWVIIGEHVDKEKAQALLSKEDDVTVEDIQHFWIRYEFISEDEALENDYEWNERDRPRWWVLCEQKQRPRGVTRKATVIIPS